MLKIEWGEYLQLGIPEVDQRNKQFVEKVNQLNGNIRKEKDLSNVSGLLSNVADHVSQHFRLEETDLRDRLDALEYSDHRERHLFFEDFLRTPFLKSSGVNQLDTEELSDFFADWVDFHIQNLDKNAFCSTKG